MDAILQIVRTMKQGGLPWDKISQMINDSKKQGDPLANLIHKMEFERNTITVLLSDSISFDPESN